MFILVYDIYFLDQAVSKYVNCDFNVFEFFGKGYFLPLIYFCFTSSASYIM